MADDQREHRTREEAIASAGRDPAASMLRLDAMTPREHAEAAHRPGGSAPPVVAACPGPHHRLVYSVDQAAEQLSISTTVLWELIRAGDIPTITYAAGRRRRGVTHDALLQWITGREHAAGPTRG